MKVSELYWLSSIPQAGAECKNDLLEILSRGRV
jgi:hypothetical protein